jgi:hypothetical protein
MTEKHGPAWLSRPAVFEPFQNSGEFKCHTRQTHEPHEQTQTHRTALYRYSELRSSVARVSRLPLMFLNRTVRCVCPSALCGFERQRFSSA